LKEDGVARALFKPRAAGHRAFQGRHPLRRASFFLGGVAFLYLVTSAVLAVAGAVPTAPVLSGLDVDNYYVWQLIFVLPLVFAVWILASGTLLALGKKGCRRSELLAEAAWGWGGPLIVAWIPFLVQAAFMALGMGQEEWVGILSEPGIWQTVYFGFFVVAAIAAVRGFILAARIVHKRSWPAAILTGTGAAAVAIGAYVALIR
jgi:ABC-type Fe3+ transport system permease subunit